MSGLTFVDLEFRMRDPSGDLVVNFQAARFTTAKVSNKLHNAWLAEDGAYVIMERDFTNLTTKYNFTRANQISATVTLNIDWAARETLTYVEYNALFA